MSSYLSYLNIPKDLVQNCFSYMMNASQGISAPKVPATTPLLTIINQYNLSPWIKVAAVSGAVSVVMGAYGAHGLKNHDKRAVYDTASKYHFYHSLALLATPFFRKSNLVGSFFLGGIIIFCGTCYYYAITENTFVTHFTPIGGFMFILGWLSMLI